MPSSTITTGRCTFEVLIDHFGLDRDPALVRLAAVVHAADIDAELHSDSLGPGLLAIGLGGLEVEVDDLRLWNGPRSFTTPSTPGPPNGYSDDTGPTIASTTTPSAPTPSATRLC